MPATNIKSMFDTVGDKLKRVRFLAKHPGYADRRQRFAHLFDRFGELALVNGDGDHVIWECGTRPVHLGHVHKAHTVLASGHSNSNALTRPQHRKRAHRASHFMENFLLNFPSIHHFTPKLPSELRRESEVVAVTRAFNSPSCNKMSRSWSIAT